MGLPTLLERLSNTGGAGTAAKRTASSAGRRKADGTRTKKATAAKPAGPTDHIRDLIRDDYFKSKREIGLVRDKLEEWGHIYPVTSISGPLLRLVQSKDLRRIKEDGVWKYVNP